MQYSHCSILTIFFKLQTLPVLLFLKLSVLHRYCGWLAVVRSEVLWLAIARWTVMEIWQRHSYNDSTINTLIRLGTTFSYYVFMLPFRYIYQYLQHTIQCTPIGYSDCAIGWNIASLDPGSHYGCFQGFHNKIMVHAGSESIWYYTANHCFLAFYFVILLKRSIELGANRQFCRGWRDRTQNHWPFPASSAILKDATCEIGVKSTGIEIAQ
jgi:hypothetical protein